MQESNIPGNCNNKDFGPFSIYGREVLPCVQQGIARTLHSFAAGHARPIGSIVLLISDDEEQILYVPELDDQVKTFLRVDYPAYQDWDIITRIFQWN